jgi:hypothetical protein
LQVLDPVKDSGLAKASAKVGKPAPVGLDQKLFDLRMHVPALRRRKHWNYRIAFFLQLRYMLL